VHETGPRGPAFAEASAQREIDLYCERLGDAELARLLSILVVPAVEGSEIATTLVRSAVARLVRADAGALPTRASSALAAAVAAVASRTPTPLPAAVASGRGLRVWRPPSR
jgi:hypothetical protein